MSGARRYGGAHSPGAPPGPHRPRPGPATSRWSGVAPRGGSLRALLLMLAPSLLPFGAAGALAAGDAPTMLGLAGAWAILLLAGWTTREGLRAARAYDARAVAKPPAFPRKLFGAVCSAAGVGLCMWLAGRGLVGAGLFGAVAGLLHVAAFGSDPLRAKGVDGLGGDALDAAVTRIETARALIGEMTAASNGLGDAEIARRVRELAASAESVVGMLERDPRDMRRARRFLAVYLVGARDATVRYAQAADSGGAERARGEFLSLLDDLDANFARSREALAEDDRNALEVEIEVLRDRLKLEGV